MSILPGRVVSVFRAITGSYNPTSGKHAGVTEDDLRKRGISTENYSIAQSKESFLSDEIGKGQFVIGLPIFTTREAAQGWINNKTYEHLPAIVQVDIPLDLLTGEVPRLAIVNNNYVDSSLDRLITQDELNRLTNGERMMLGECVLRGVFGNELTLRNTGGISKELLSELRKHERIFRPKQLTDTGQLRDSLYDEVKIGLEPEASSELLRS